MTKKLICLCTAYYESKTRVNRYGNYCQLCIKVVEGECMRAVLSVNDYNGFVTYTLVHTKCYIKALPHEVDKVMKEEVKRRKEFKENLKAIKKLCGRRTWRL